MAQIAWSQGQPLRTARLFGAAEALREKFCRPLPPVDRGDYDCVPAARATLGEDLFAATWTEGRAMTLEQAIAYALEEGSD
jgi:hypothetical protein